MADEIRRLSEAMARDPGSLAFLQLGEALRRRGQLDMAGKVVVRGLERHPYLAEGHDLLARISIDAGDLERAFDEWDAVRKIAPEHIGALKGMGFVCFRQGRLQEAEQYLANALAADALAADAGPPGGEGEQADDGTIGQALDHVRAQLSERDRPYEPASPVPPISDGRSDDARMLFAGVIGEGEQTALLLDADGLVMAGLYLAPDGRDVAQEVGAVLSGVSDEARRAVRHLDLGDWTSIVFETGAAIVAMAPAPDRGLLLVAAARETPLGLVRRLLERAGACVREWLGADGRSA
ncbi:MAG: roadblock/LC7 domain-containing protein [Gemmatimonadaceae bacterium]